MATALSPAPSRRHVWRMRAALVVDVAVGLATLPVFVLTMGTLNAALWRVDPPVQQQMTWWSLLLMSTITFALGGGTMVLLARLAARGQTPGLAAVGLRWGDGPGRAAGRWLLGEPQLWCAALPTVYVLLACATGTLQFFARSIWLYSALVTVGALIGPALVLGALACMVLSRRRPGQLVAGA